MKTLTPFSFLPVAFGLLSAIGSHECFAQTKAGPVSIVQITTGWSTEQFGLVVDSPIVNPVGCTFPDSYAVDSTTPGYKLYYAAALMAFASAKTVYVYVSNTTCTSSRPTIIGVFVNR